MFSTIDSEGDRTIEIWASDRGQRIEADFNPTGVDSRLLRAYPSERNLLACAQEAASHIWLRNEGDTVKPPLLPVPPLGFLSREALLGYRARRPRLFGPERGRMESLRLPSTWHVAVNGIYFDPATSTIVRTSISSVEVPGLSLDQVAAETGLTRERLASMARN